MKTRSRSERGWRYNVPLPMASVMGFALFFAGYYVSTTNEGTAMKNEHEIHHKILLENSLMDPFEHGESGDNTISDIPFQVLSWKPRAILFPNFASREQCEHIIKLAESRLTPSLLALRRGETNDATKDVRTSSGTFLSWEEDSTGTLSLLEEKMARATMTPRNHGETFNVLRYQLGQRYQCHYDVFNPAEYGPQESQRLASMLLYLSDVDEGGETMFPFENYENMEGYDYKRCVGLKVKPRQGDALLFYSLHPNGTFDKAALHGSCPVIKGEKWVATKWIRDHPHHP